jgi:hypothetical protein
VAKQSQPDLSSVRGPASVVGTSRMPLPGGKHRTVEKHGVVWRTATGSVYWRIELQSQETAVLPFEYTIEVSSSASMCAQRVSVSCRHTHMFLFVRHALSSCASCLCLRARACPLYVGALVESWCARLELVCMVCVYVLSLTRTCDDAARAPHGVPHRGLAVTAAQRRSSLNSSCSV